MRFSALSIVVLSTCVAIAGCHSSKKASKTAEKLPGNWPVQPVVIDGDNKDWPSPYPNYDAKGMVAYATSNDRHYVYITVETGDEITQMKILKAGMTVSVDTSGKKDPQFNINYPLPNDNEMLDLPQPVKGQKGGMHMEKQLTHQVKRIMDQATQFTLEGFRGCNGGFLIAQNVPCGVKVKAGIDEFSELVWEAAIPVSALYGKDSLTVAEAGKPITVCVAIKGMKAPKKTGDEQNNNIGTGGTGMTGMGGGRGGSGGGHGGGGRSGGGRSAVENPLDHLYNSTKTWKQFGLAVQP